MESRAEYKAEDGKGQGGAGHQDKATSAGKIRPFDQNYYMAGDKKVPYKRTSEHGICGGLSPGDFRFREKLEALERHERRQRLKQEQEARITAARKASEKTLHEQMVDKQARLKQYIDGIRRGTPWESGDIGTILGHMNDILGYCLAEKGPD